MVCFHSVSRNIPLVSGGILCVAAVGVVCAALPAFSGYVAAPSAAGAPAKSESIA